MITVEVMVYTVAQGNITLFGKKILPDTIFIDHISTIVRRRGSRTHFMQCAEFRAVCRIRISNGTAITGRDRVWQI